MLAHPVGEAVGINPVDPALQDRRHREPPEREGQDQGVGPQQLVLLRDHILRRRAVGERVARCGGHAPTLASLSKRWPHRSERHLDQSGFPRSAFRIIGKLSQQREQLQEIVGI